MKTLLFVCLMLFAFSSSACAAGKKRVAIDPNTASTIVEGDATVVIVGTNNKPNVGFSYNRVREGDNTGQFISFIAPPSKCKREECVYFKVWNQQGALIWGGSIPKDKISVSVDWKTLTGRSEFLVFDRGFWTVNETLYWIDTEGRERESTAQGDIILRVYKKDYLPLHNVENDPSFVWEYFKDKYIFKFTSSLRTYVGERKI